MVRLIEDLKISIPAAFESDDSRARIEAIESEFNHRSEKAFGDLQKRAGEKSIALVRTPVGMALAPVHEGEVLGRSRHGHYQMRFMHLIHKRQGEGGGGSGGGGCWRAPMTHTLGGGGVAEALAGQLAHFPLETVQTAAEAAAAAQQAAAGPQACSKAALRPQEAAVSSGSGALPEWVRLSYLQESRRQQEQPSATAVCAEQ